MKKFKTFTMVTRMHSCRMRTTRSLTISPYLVVCAMYAPLPCMSPLPNMPPTMHAPCHACPLPHMPPAMHPLPCTPCHAFPPPCMPPCHAHTHPATHALLPCTPPCGQTDTCKNITLTVTNIQLIL